MSEWRDKLLTEADNARLRAENAKLKHELELEKFRGAGEIEAYRRETSVAVKKASQAKAENDKLRERVAELEELTDEKRYIPQEWYQLATAENKKLRELVAEIWPIAEYAGYEHELIRARELMRELGMEVDE